jgi:hypothetical protein
MKNITICIKNSSSNFVEIHGHKLGANLELPLHFFFPEFPFRPLLLLTLTYWGTIGADGTNWTEPKARAGGPCKMG